MKVCWLVLMYLPSSITRPEQSKPEQARQGGSRSDTSLGASVSYLVKPEISHSAILSYD